jgi:hypothetical protein
VSQSRDTGAVKERKMVFNCGVSKKKHATGTLFLFYAKGGKLYLIPNRWQDMYDFFKSPEKYEARGAFRGIHYQERLHGNNVFEVKIQYMKKVFGRFAVHDQRSTRIFISKEGAVVAS